MLRVIFISVVILFMSMQNRPCYSQSLRADTLKNWQLKGYAESAVKGGDYYMAIYLLEAYIQKKTRAYNEMYLLAELLSETRNYAPAEALFKKIIDKKKNKFPKAEFNLAKILKNNEKYTEAHSLLKNIEKNARKQALPVDRQLLLNEIEGCLLAIKDTNLLSEIIALHIDTTINKSFIEFAPLQINDTILLFGSVEKEEILSGKSKTNYRKFYTANSKNENYYNRSVSETPPFFNFEDAHTGNGCFSIDGKRFYSTRCEKNIMNKIICSIHVSELKNGEWVQPVSLDNTINSKDYTSTQMTVGNYSQSNIEIIYFSSDRPGGFGGYDIWYSVYNKNTESYTEACNAGSAINTIADEKTPFYDINSGILYFSSTGWSGYGGFDVFKSQGNLVNWSKPENAGKPINTGADDLFYSLNKDGKKAFLISNRKGSIPYKHDHCCDDIYSLQFEK
ncbi:MAG: hypothetical protein A2275_04740 [Bacteroidetes bacterium RIFOXYA12_FULL_35_11]|nr:MAG: hypothetical protein A2X01_13950 [Bacteroidetes bacterium GWF2_35_48]OFY73984.1 MAG: hypothetical protein A2275_04740 [Bacteroidetes bacterium RIFOXYA12_FULL_35_11]HBX52104.1 hypothetical protein [Bacteroidales bacterium]